MAYTVTVLDAASIQSYVFGSNELRENIGASELVYRATKRWAFEALAEVLPKRHNIDMGAVQADATRVYDPRFHIENESRSGAAAEVLYAGGGNTVILFGGPDHAETAKQFVYTLSRRVLLDAPGLNLYAAHHEVDSLDTAAPLVKAIDEAFEQLGRYKESVPGPVPLLGLSVTAACTSTGLPANGSHPDPDKRGTLASLANKQVLKKWAAAKWAEDRLKKLFRLDDLFAEYQLPPNAFEWTADLDKIGGLTGRGESYIAVVHADGNGMGARIEDLKDKYLTGEHKDEPARHYIKAMRKFSDRIQATAQEALRTTFEGLFAKLVSSNTDDGLYAYEKDAKGNITHSYFPFRPIVFGGDDVTWVCAGPWGLTLAKRYLRELEAGDPLPDGDLPYAAAGVTIVKTHYPFSRAYEMSESLLKSAKGFVKACQPDKRASGIDWHVTTTGLSGSLDDIRKREYTTPEGSLLMRPLMLNHQDDWRTWENFDALVRAFRDHWQDQRNKVHRLREALREGPKAVQQFDTIFLSQEADPKKKLPVLRPMPLGYQDGWVNATADDPVKRCLYFDAVEMHDQFFDLTD